MLRQPLRHREYGCPACAANEVRALALVLVWLALMMWEIIMLIATYVYNLMLNAGLLTS